MPGPEQVSRYKPGENVPGFAATAVAAGRFVKLTGPKTSHGDYQIGHCGVGERPFGVAEATSAAASLPAHSHDRRVNVARRGAIARVEVGAGGVTAGVPVKSDGNGLAVAHDTGVIAGVACDTVTAGNYAEIELI